MKTLTKIIGAAMIAASSFYVGTKVAAEICGSSPAVYELMESAGIVEKSFFCAEYITNPTYYARYSQFTTQAGLEDLTEYFAINVTPEEQRMIVTEFFSTMKRKDQITIMKEMKRIQEED
jgi:hypothetical protein